MNIYIGGLSYSTTEETLKDLFAGFGTVNSVKIITDKFTGNPRGFAFVEMGSEDEGQQAIDSLNGKDIDGKTVTVNKARPRENNNGGGGRAPFKKRF